MKKLLVVAVVMLVASMANAGMLLSVNGVVDPIEPVVLMPSDTVIIDIAGDGQTAPGAFYLALAVEGPGSLDISNTIFNYAGTDKGIMWDPEVAIEGFQFPVANISLNDVPAPGTPKAPLLGKLVDNILFHCDGVGEVTIALFNGDGEMLDSQVIIQQIPEPMTMSLLGLGALLIRRK